MDVKVEIVSFLLDFDRGEYTTYQTPKLEIHQLQRISGIGPIGRLLTILQKALLFRELDESRHCIFCISLSTHFHFILFRTSGGKQHTCKCVPLSLLCLGALFLLAKKKNMNHKVDNDTFYLKCLDAFYSFFTIGYQPSTSYTKYCKNKVAPLVDQMSVRIIYIYTTHLNISNRKTFIFKSQKMSPQSRSLK